MSRIRTQNEIISSLLDFFRVAQPDLSTIPGAVARDLFVDGISAQIARLYNELDKVSTLQSLRQALGIDLDRLGANFGLKRLAGSKASGTALFTFNTLDTDFSINQNQSISARNSATFLVTNSVVISVVLANQYKATAALFKSDLDFIGITDQYAIEVATTAASTGTQGNISKYSLTNASIPSINHVTNTAAFGGGSGAETDTAFRNRILGVFSGANTGTALGYKNAVLSNPAVIDAVVIQPGDPLMTRDGTQVSIAADGTRTIISEGTGGKVDVIVYGVSLQGSTDSFIYRDLSNTGDPTNSKNDFILGQITSDAGKTVTKKRLDDLTAGTLPSQPINNIVSISGSISGGNFVEQTTDSLGRTSGNYILIRDTGVYSGSPWGFDKLHFTSNKISDLSEDETKQTFNGQDALSFPDVLEISGVTQNISVTNENSTVNSLDRTSIQLSHFPVTNVTRVFNVTTGERYTISSQNPDGSGSINNNGRVIISGKSLPAISDILQVDYTWVFNFDPNFDFDNRLTKNNPRIVKDSIDWGFSNAVRREQVTLISTGSFLTATVTHPISAVVTVNVFTNENSIITLSSGRLAVIITTNVVSNVVSIIRNSDGAEIWDTNKLDGTFSGFTIFLPTDTQGQFNDSVSVIYNAIDVYNASTQGNFNNNVITIVPSASAVAGNIVECTYIANINTLLPSTLLSALPAIRANNGFNTGAALGVGSQPTTNILVNGTVQSNLRQAPSNIGLTIAGTISSGIITLSGTTITGVFSSVFTVSAAGLKIDLSIPLKKALSLSSSASIPSNIRVARIISVENVVTTSGFDVLSVNSVYDIKGYHLFDNTFVKDEAIKDSTLKLTEFTLPSTTNNSANAPVIGNRLRVTFYYIKTSDSENVSFSKSGTLYTNKRFAIIDTMAISSGFTSGSSSSATLTVTNLNQPTTRSRYKAIYDYLAPKPNERITINYNFDRLITDSTFAIETTRPINADVLAKAATPILINVTMNISVTEDFINQTNIVLQNVQNVITTALNSNALGTKVDSSDLVNQAYTITGVDSARVIFFNKANLAGTVLKIQAQKNEFLSANQVIIQLESS